ncbi:MAG: MFS transporter [Chloroflexi bacterium]|nr:MFS transporter [Chloroflexota bacterium]
MQTTLPRPLAVPVPALPPAVLATLLVAGHAVKHTYNSGFFLILPEIARALNLSNTSIGFLNTARSFAGSGSNLPAGFVADRFSNRWGRILGVAMVVIGIFQFIMGSLDAYWSILTCAMVVSAAIAFWHPPAIAALSLRFSERRGFAISLHGSGGSIGEAVGPIIVGGLLGVLTWQGILQLSLVPAVLTGAVVWILMRNTTGHLSGTTSFGGYLGSLRAFITNPHLAFIFLSVGAFSMAQAAVGTFLPIYLRNELNYPPIVAAGYLFLGQVAGIGSSPVLGYLSDRFGRRATLVPSLLFLSVGIFALSVASEGLALMASVAWIGVFMFPLMSLFLASAMDRVGAAVQATTVSLVFGIGSLFGSFSPTIAGLLADSFGVQTAFYWGAAIALVAAMLVAFASESTKAEGVRL